MGTLREMTMSDYDQVIEMWKSVEGLAISQADSRENIGRYLERNPGMSYIFEEGGVIAGTILCGHDGRRGFIHHLAVHPGYRKLKIGRQLVEAGLDKLHGEGIDKCHIFVIDDNEAGHRFWTAEGWEKRSGFGVYSKNIH